MEPLTLVLLLIVAWAVFGDGGQAGGSSAAPGAGSAGAVPPQMGANAPIDQHGAEGACPPGTQWNGTGCTEPPHQATDQTAQPIGSDVAEDKPLVPLRAGEPETYGHYVPPPPRTTAQHQLRALGMVHRGGSAPVPVLRTKPTGGGGFLS